MTIDPRVGCSTISFRSLSLPDALGVISGLGFAEVDLGALPGVCDHVPYELTPQAVQDVATQINASGLLVRSVNGDIGDLNDDLDASTRAERDQHLNQLLQLSSLAGAAALVLPCGAQSHEPKGPTLDADLDVVAGELNAAAARAAAFAVELWVESLHFFRLCCNAERAALLHDRLDPAVGIVMDFSHVTASGGRVVDFAASTDRIRHVHLRDARPGNIHLSVGNGEADFAGGLATLAARAYDGHFALELETRDIEDSERPAAAKQAGELISGLVLDAP